MKTFWVFLWGGLAIIGTAEARLGETIEEIEKRLGTLHTEDHFTYPEDCFQGTVEGRGGFDKIVHTFFKKDSEKRCVSIIYLKGFEKIEDAYRFEDAKKLLKKNFPRTEPTLVDESLGGIRGIRNGEQVEDLWRATWWDLNTEGMSTAFVTAREGGGISFSLIVKN